MTMYREPNLDDGLSPQLADLICEALVWSNAPDERARVLLQIVGCAVDALGWRLQPEGDPHEEHSAQEIVQAAAGHLARMQSRG